MSLVLKLITSQALPVFGTFEFPPEGSDNANFRPKHSCYAPSSRLMLSHPASLPKSVNA